MPAWIRTGLLPLGLGGLLLGLVWPYVLGGFGSHIGSLAVGLGALLLLIGGGLGARATRREGQPPLV